MPIKHLKVIFLLLLVLIPESNSYACDKDKRQTIVMYISEKTGTWQPWNTEHPVSCMLVKEKGDKEWQPLDFAAIKGFTYKKGYKYTLSVEKMAPANPPADGSSIAYKLLKILKKQRRQKKP